MLIRPKSASRTRTVHVDSRVLQTNTENITNENLGIIHGSDPVFNDGNITDDDNFPTFDTKMEILREDKEWTNEAPINEKHRKNDKRSISSQDYTGIFKRCRK